MYTILVAGIPISLDIKYENDFSNSYKYKTDLEPKYYIKSNLINELDFPNVGFLYETKFYKKYKINDHIIQIQYFDDELVGSIDYFNNEINVNLYKQNSIIEYLLTQYALSYILSENNAIIMHGSSLLYKDLGIIFTAKSGTGKSTHSRLWQKYSDAVVINDDKNILKIENDELILYSSPWSGKHKLDNNIHHKLNALIFLYQRKDNYIEKLSKMKAFKLLMTQIDYPKEENIDLWNKIVDKLLNLNIYYLGCNMERDAFEVSKNQIENDLIKE